MKLSRVHVKPRNKRYSLKTRLKGFESHRWRVPDPMKAVENVPKFHGLDDDLYGAEIKYDGTRVFLMKSGNQVRLFGASRIKNEYSPRYPQIIEDGKKIKAEEVIIDGELTFFDKRTGNDIFVTALARPETIALYDVKVMCFDILFFNEQGNMVQRLPYPERKKLLKEIIPDNLPHIKYVWWRKDRQKQLYDEYTSKGGEGIVIKNKRGVYQEGVRSPEWRKIKADDTDDVVVVGWTEGTGARAPYFGALCTAQYKPDGSLKFTGNVGGGFDDNDLVKIKNLLDHMPKEPVSPFNILDRRDAGLVHYVKPELVIEVKFMMKTPSGKFRMPRFQRIRVDKTPEECIYNPTSI